MFVRWNSRTDIGHGCLVPIGPLTNLERGWDGLSSLCTQNFINRPLLWTKFRALHCWARPSTELINPNIEEDDRLTQASSNYASSYVSSYAASMSTSMYHSNSKVMEQLPSRSKFSSDANNNVIAVIYTFIYCGDGLWSPEEDTW